MAIKPMKTLNFGGEDTYLLKPDWDDVDNRPFYEEPPTETMLVDNATIELVDMNGDGSIGISQNPFTMEIAEGVEYTITWNGDVYTATGCVDGLPYVGNYAIATGMNDTGEPFLLIDLSAFGMGFGVYSTIIGLATISVSATISNIHTIDPKFLPKPLQFGEKFEYGTIFPEQTLALGEAGEGMYAAQVECPNIISPGRTYDVTYNGTKYSSTATLFDGIGCIGNLSLLGFGADTGEPFFAGAADGILIFYATDSSATLSIEGDVAIVTQIDEKFVPERDYSEIYAAKSHNHDSSYAAKSHNHDSSYAAKSHNHDSSYAAKSHNHDSDYADINHNHDEDYAALDHTHSYNDLEDKLVGYIPSDTLTWDGDTTGLIHVDGTGAYKVSDKTPTKDEVLNAGGSYTTIYKGEKQVTEITSTSIMVFNDQIYSIGSNIIVVSVDGATCTGLTFPMAGIYFTLTNDIFIPSLTINGIELGRRTKQLDNKYLEPFETVGGDTLTWDGNTEGLYGIDMLGTGSNNCFLISDVVPTVEELNNVTSITHSDGNEATREFFESVGIPVVEDAFGDGKVYILFANNVLIVMEDYETSMEEATFSFKKGVYFTVAEKYVTSLKINGYRGFPTTKLKEEYLPQTTQAGVFYFKFTAPGAEADPYIYHDAECTSKVTKAELLDAGKKGAVRVFNAVGGFSTALSVVVYSDYASVLLVHSSTNAEPGAVQVTYKNLFTAEYTPTT